MFEDKQFYVYAFIRLDTNTYFYIGKGKNNRYKRIDYRSKHFKNIIDKVDCALEILYDNLTENEAFILERDTIEDLVFNEGYTIEVDNDKDKNKGYNHLVNCTYGGEGISGYKYTDEQREKCSRKGSQNGMYGKKGKLCPHYGKTFSEEHKERIMLSNPKRYCVYCVELNLSFNSYREAEKILLEEYNIICSHATISSICRGKSKCGGKLKETGEKVYLHFIKL